MLRAALFDLDRTLVRRETATLYVRYQRSIGEATWRDSARLLVWVAQYTLGVLDAPGVAKKGLRAFAGMQETVLAARCDDWFRRYVEEHVADLGRAAVAKHRSQGDILAIVTGASPYVARPLARRLGIDHVVSSELEIDAHGAFTGRVVDPLCYGVGKLERAYRFADKLGFDLANATFYSDSYTDLPLLEKVGEPIVVNPDPRLKRFATKRGWPIQIW